MAAANPMPTRLEADPDRLLTTPEIASELGTTLDRINYAILRHRIDPDTRVVRFRLFKASRLDEFAAALGLGAEAVAD